jgi:hypothetical protein
MDVPYREHNKEGLSSLRALIERLSDEDLSRDIGDGWTVAVALAHVAFWDRYLAARWDHALREGLAAPEGLPIVPDFINEASLVGWRACPPREAAKQALAAAESIEKQLAELDPALPAAALAGGRPSLVDRSLHWLQHIDQIERAIRAAG